MSRTTDKCPNGCAYLDHKYKGHDLWWSSNESADREDFYTVYIDVSDGPVLALLKCDSELAASDELHRVIEDRPSERMREALTMVLLGAERT